MRGFVGMKGLAMPDFGKSEHKRIRETVSMWIFNERGIFLKISLEKLRNVSEKKFWKFFRHRWLYQLKTTWQFYDSRDSYRSGGTRGVTWGLHLVRIWWRLNLIRDQLFWLPKTYRPLNWNASALAIGCRCAVHYALWQVILVLNQE